MENNVNITPGFAGGEHITDGPLTTTVVEQITPGLIKNDVDERVIKLKPMATPVDQISRMIGARKCKSMIVEYYSVDTKKPTTRMMGSLTATDTVHPGGKAIYIITTQDDNAFSVSDTILVPGVNGVKAQDMSAATGLVLYVTEVVDKNKIKVIAVNGEEDGTVKGSIPNATLVRMARAAGELDVLTPQYEALPKKSRNYCQIFKAQVEQSHIMRQSAKEVGWSFVDQEEVAITDMRMCMEKSFMFGSMARIMQGERGDEIMFTGGIWSQAENSVSYREGEITAEKITEIMKKAFTGSASGSSRKILFAGSSLISDISNLDATRVLAAKDKVTHWGIDFNEIHSKFGTLLVIYSEVFDQCEHARDGLIVDPEYLTKYVQQPMKAEKIDMKMVGTRNTEAVVITEASCLVLRNPKTHTRVVFKD
ncbi:MAG: DUF5309 domain-containing protein [Paramuribaculum sp.]|nr:DUF5309 domain-containing protein [Paramuribaculum sp.]